METIDFNGAGRWSAQAILTRYVEYAIEVGTQPRDLTPIVHTEGDRRWVYPVMNEVIAGIEAGDPACIQIGIEFIEEDQGFPFGKILKSNTARALRRAPLLPEQQRRIARRVFDMLQRGYVPHEYREYAKLARRIGFALHDLPAIVPQNRYVNRYWQYFQRAASQPT